MTKETGEKENRKKVAAVEELVQRIENLEKDLKTIMNRQVQLQEAFYRLHEQQRRQERLL